MTRAARAAWVLAFVLAPTQLAHAQQQGGALRVYHRDNLPSASIHEEATIPIVAPLMGVFDTLVLFDQTQPLDTVAGIVPDPAQSWAWDATSTRLSFALRPTARAIHGLPPRERNANASS